MRVAQTDEKTSLGIDVSKATLDVVLLLEPTPQVARFPNTTLGFTALLSWLAQHGVEQIHACLEATGSYSDAISQFLASHGKTVSLLNPAVLVDYRRSCNIRRKTDTLDALLLARYGQERHPPAWYPLSSEVQELRSLLASRDDFMLMRVQETNRLKAGRLDLQVKAIVEQHRALLKGWQKDMEKRIQSLIESSETLAKPYQHLQTIPGIGWYAAARLLAHLGDIRRFPKVGAVVSLAGLSVRVQESGRTVHHRPHIDYHGRQDLRSLMYLCTMAALRVNPDLRAWRERLRQRGKPGKVVMIALTRKMLHLAYGVWKNDCDYDPTRAFAVAQE